MFYHQSSHVINNNNIRLVTLAEHTSDHDKQQTQAQKKRGSMARKLLGANAKSYRLKLKLECIYEVVNNNNKWPLTPKSMPPAGDEHAKLKT